MSKCCRFHAARSAGEVCRKQVISGRPTHCQSVSASGLFEFISTSKETQWNRLEYRRISPPMLKAQIRPGSEYALREKRDAPLQRVRVLGHIRGSKWRAEWIDPNPGLVHFVESGHLLVPWKEHKAFLKEEADETRLEEQNAREGYERDSPVTRALEQVYESVGDDGVNFYNGTLSGTPEALERLKLRAGVPVDKQSPFSYVDRRGEINLSFADALEIARAFCATEPTTILTSIETTERQWTSDARRGEDHIIPLLNDYRASWALIRQWTGHDPAVAQREAEIQKLERLVWDAVYALQKAGLDSEAGRLRRAIERR